MAETKDQAVFKKAVSRRAFLAGSAAVGLAAVAGCAGGAPSSQAPAQTGTTELYILKGLEGVEDQDNEFEAQAQAWGKEAKVKVKVERVAGKDVQPRVATALQSKTGPDLLQIQANWAWLYADSLVDVSDVAGEVEKNVGGFYQDQKANNFVKDKGWRAVPYQVIANAYAYRTDWFQQNSITPPKTWDEFYATGKKMKAFGKPYGQAHGHSQADPNCFFYPLLWCFGGKEVLEDGKTVAINSPETLKAVEFAVALFNDVWAPGVLSWDDNSNNRAYPAEEISCTLNGMSIYYVCRRDFPKIAAVTDHFPQCKGNAGPFQWNLQYSQAIPTYSKNASAAKDCIRYVMQPANYSKWLGVGGGYSSGCGLKHSEDPVWSKDPKSAAFRDAAKVGLWPGYPGVPNAAASDVLVRYIIIDLFAKPCSGELTPKDAVAWAENQLKAIYK